MNYEKIYYDFCSSRQALSRKKNEGEYFEEHHIKPKSLFPELKNDKTNLVLLTPREHYLAHLLLIRFTKGDAKFRMICAFCRFCHGKNAEKFKNGKEYEKYRLLWHKELSERMKGRKMDPAVVKRGVEKRRMNGTYKQSVESREKLKEIAKRQFSTDESKKRHSELMKKYYAEHPETHTGVYKGTKYGSYSPERIEATRNGILNSEKWKEKVYTVECVETGERFSQSLLANKLNIPRHKLKPLIIREEEINGKHYRFRKETN